MGKSRQDSPGDRHRFDDAWDAYWSAGQLAACFSDARGCYEGEIARLWQEFFQALPDAARLLDVGTGNGAVALIAAQVGRAAKKHFRIHAIDRARIDPATSLHRAPRALDDIEFHPGTPAEETQFESASFDYVVSQYGFEYSDMARSARELSRVTRPQGRLQLVVHAKEGSVYARSVEVLNLVDRVNRKVGLLDTAARMVRQVMALERGARPPSPEAEQEFFRTRSTYQAGVRELCPLLDNAALRAPLKNIFTTIEHAFNHRASFTEIEITDKIEQLGAELRGHEQRLQALTDAALDSESLDALCRDLQNCGFQPPDVAPVEEDGMGLIAYRIRTQRCV